MERTRQAFENCGITVTSTAGYDSNANGRAERAVRFFLEKIRTLCASRIRSEVFQSPLKQLWTFVAQRAGEVHRRDLFGEPPCKYEFGQCVLSRVKEPETKISSRLQKVIFLGFAPNVTNRYFVMRPDLRIELTSNINEETVFDEPEGILKESRTALKDQGTSHQDEPHRDKELEAIMGFEGGEGWLYGEDRYKVLDFRPQDDPMAIVSTLQAKLARISENLWQQEDLRSEEIPEELRTEIKESGQVTVTLRDVRNSIGKDRQQWQVALESELQSLRDTGAIQTVPHVPHGKQILPMKVVLTLKPVPGVSTKKKKARVCVCGNFQQKKPTDLFYTANTDVSSIRLVLAEAAQKSEWGISNLDVATAFLNAPMPVDEKETVYVKPPALLEQFRLIKPGTYWKLTKAVYGLRVSPRLWGKERDLQLRKLRFKVKGRILRAVQSSIDYALWMLVDDKVQDFDQKRATYAHLLTYVDDFLMVGPWLVRSAIEEEISRVWKVRVEGRVNQFDDKKS